MPVSLGCCKGLNKIIYIRHLKHLASLNGSHAIFDLLLSFLSLRLVTLFYFCSGNHVIIFIPLALMLVMYLCYF